MSDSKDENETPDHCDALADAEQRLKEARAEHEQLLEEFRSVLGKMLDTEVPTSEPSE